MQRGKTPLVRVAETAECGLACITMIAVAHGHDVSLNSLRQRFPASMSGATLTSLLRMAESLDLRGRALQVPLEEIEHLQTPALLHWDMAHFVVLVSVRKGVALIHDPALGARKLRLGELSKHFTGVAVEFDRLPGFEPLSDKESVRWSDLWTGVAGGRAAVMQILLLSAALQALAFIAPFQIQLAVDQGVLRGDDYLLGVVALAFMGIVVIQACVEGLRTWALQVLGQMLSFHVLSRIFRHLLRLPTSYFERRHVGGILSRIGSSTALQDILTRGVITSLIDGAMASLAVVILLAYSIELTLIVLGSLAISGAGSLLMFRALRRRSEDQIVAKAAEQSFVMETVRAATIIKIMGGETQREMAWANRYSRVVNATLSITKFNIAIAMLQSLTAGAQTVLIIYLGAMKVIEADGFSLGMLFAYLAFRQTFTDRGTGLINQFIQFRFIGLHLERLSDILGSPTEAGGAGETREGEPARVTLEFNNVGFRYAPSDPDILKGIDLTIRQGEYLAITGPSAGGKTTFLKLLLGLNQPTSGQILLEGQPATPERWRAWRRSVGVVSQDDRLLSGTFAENIAFFDPDLDMKRVRSAAIDAQIADDIDRMPMGYRSLIGDMGSSLSGGQQQRLILARALYRNPQVLVLDEGTANLDQDNENRIAVLIAGLPITRIVVAHRPRLLEDADRVMALSGGRLEAVDQD